MTRRINVRVPFLRDGWRPSRGRDNTRPNRSTYLAVVAAIVSVALAGFAWYERDQADRRSDTVTACLAAATPASQAIFSYDYRTFDAGVATARSFITGAFVNDYAATAASLKATAIQAQAIVQAQVSAVGVVDASPTGVDVMGRGQLQSVSGVRHLKVVAGVREVEALIGEREVGHDRVSERDG
jgi:Mce-associated membrane protein